MTEKDRIDALEAIVDAAWLAMNRLQDEWEGSTTEEFSLFKELLRNYRNLTSDWRDATTMNGKL